MSRRQSVKTGPWPTVAAHGIVLFSVLVFFRLSKIALTEVRPSGWEVVALILPELGFVLLFEGVWLALGRGRGGRVWRVLLEAGHLVVYAHLLINHGFFVNTGYRVDFALASYAVTNLDNVWEILAEGARFWFWLQVLVVLTGMLVAGRLAVFLERRRLAAPRAPAVAAMPLLGLALLLLPPVGDPSFHDLSGNDAIAFAASTVRSALPEDTSVAGMVAPDELYQQPRLLSKQTERRPNIVLLILESTGAQVTSIDFSGSGLSPNLAEIAEQSIVLESAYTTVSHTSKTLVGILCGMMARGEMQIFESLSGGLPLECLPRLLAELGYRTAFLQTARGSFENRPGLVENLGFQHGAYQETLHREPFKKTGYLGLDEFAMLQPAVVWAREGDAPFFLTLLTVSPHHPYELPGRPKEGTDEERYRQALQHQDAFAGALFRGLDQVGALEDTLFIVLGDHGEAFGEHGLQEHDAVPYEEVVWTPWLLHGPDWLGEPRRLPGLRTQLDLVPTILDVLGAEWEGRLPGRSLLSSAGHEAVITSCWDRGRCLSMRRGDDKFVYHFGRKPTEVYDLEADATEREDLADAWSEADLSQVETKLRAFRLSVDLFWSQFPYSGTVKD